MKLWRMPSLTFGPCCRYHYTISESIQELKSEYGRDEMESGFGIAYYGQNMFASSTQLRNLAQGHLWGIHFFRTSDPWRLNRVLMVAVKLLLLS